MEKYCRQPNAGTTFSGYKIPFTKEIIVVAYNAHGKTPHVGIISWDFMVDGKDDVVLIEANFLGQDIWFPQIIHGCLPFHEQTEQILNILNNNSGKND